MANCIRRGRWSLAFSIERPRLQHSPSHEAPCDAEPQKTQEKRVIRLHAQMRKVWRAAKKRLGTGPTKKFWNEGKCAGYVERELSTGQQTKDVGDHVV